MNLEKFPHLKYNYIVNVLDGGFFGFALGFASFSTVIPLFVSTMTDSAILIGLIPAIHTVGWQLPQLLTAQHVSRLSNYKPMVMMMTIQERLPFLGLALLAWLLPGLNNQIGLIITFLFLIWQGLGGGFAATPWQSLIGKIIPGDIRGSFFGMQSSAANLFAGIGAIIAGFILDKADTPFNFAICFFLASIFMTISWFILNLTREGVRRQEGDINSQTPFWQQVGTILRKNKSFRWYLVARMLTQLVLMSTAFYTVYAVHHLNIGVVTVGILTSVLLITQVIANPILGRISDRWSRKSVLELGAIAATLSAILAWLASGVELFYLVFIFAGIGFTTYWTIGLALTLEFGSEEERPAYIGLANTLVAPSTILAPIIGGWLADAAGFRVTFITAAFFGLLTILVLHLLVQDPQKVSPHNMESL
jgi:MFS family permease